MIIRRNFSSISNITKYLVLSGYLILSLTGFSTSGFAQSNQEAASLIFSQPYIKQLGYPASIAYRYSHSTPLPAEYGPEFEEKVSVEVTKPNTEDGFNSVMIVLDDAKRSREIGPFDNTSGNPVVMMFLERELIQMRSQVSGTPVYFRNTIRRAFLDGATIEPVQISLTGKTVEAKRITIKPFADETDIGRFGKFTGKVIETIVTDAVPGGIYEMRSLVPPNTTNDNAGANDAMLVTNLLRYNE